MSKRSLLGYGAALLLICGSFALGLRPRVRDPEIVEFPDDAGPRLEVLGRMLSLSGTEEVVVLHKREKPLLLLVFSVDCEACEATFPHWLSLVERARGLGPRAPEIVAVSVSSADETAAYWSKHSISGVRLVRNRDARMRPLGVFYFPSTVLLEPPGTHTTVWNGLLNAATVGQIMEELK